MQRLNLITQQPKLTFIWHYIKLWEGNTGLPKTHKPPQITHQGEGRRMQLLQTKSQGCDRVYNVVW